MSGSDNRLSKHQILILSCEGVPHPSRGASTVLFFLYIKALLDAGYVVQHFIFGSRSQRTDQELSDYNAALSGYDFSVSFISVAPLTAYARFYRDVKFGTADLPISQLKKPYDLVVYFDIASLGILASLRLQRSFVWLGDLTFQTIWYHWLYDFRENLSLLFKFPRILLRCLAWRRSYKNLLKNEKFIVVSSHSSVNKLSKKGINSTYQPYPWPDSALKTNQIAKDIVPTFLFFGNLGALGSKSAFRFLLKEIYPHLVSEWGTLGFKIKVAGTRLMPHWVEKALLKKREFEYLGYVENLSDLVNKCHAVLVPIDVPVGNRSRIITAMSLGAVVIAHRNVSLGNPELRSGFNCLLANSGKEFYCAMRMAYDSRESSEQISVAARETYDRVFEPSAALKSFLSTIREAIEVYKKESDTASR